MPNKDPRIDAYIAQSADFAKPILTHVRKLVHAACPDVLETLKWKCPHFEHKGLILGMAGFKHHCAVHFSKGKLFIDDAPTQTKEMGQFGRITTLADLPDDKTLIGYIKKAVELNEAEVKNPSRPKPKGKKEVAAPDYFLKALKKSKKALTAFESFSPSHKREYVEWITEAKREETRARRIKTAIKWMEEGKPRNWKYR